MYVSYSKCMGTLEQPTSYFGSGITINGEIRFEGEFLQDPVRLGVDTTAESGSTAIGVGADGSGDGVVALGDNATATDTNAAALGKNSEASAGDATAVGNEAIASSRWNTVIGYDAGSQQNGDNIVLLGRKSEAEGNNGVAIGELSIANGDNSTAIGRGTEALQSGSSVFGQGSTVDGTDATVVGQGVTVNVDDAISVGSGVTVTGQRSTVIGTNASVTSQDGIAVGESAEATADSATAIGKGSSASGVNSLAVGVDTTVTQDDTYGFGDRNLNLPQNRSLLYPKNSGIQTLVDLPVDSQAPQGERQEYTFEVGGDDLLIVRAESDGSGGIQNQVVVIPDDLSVAGSVTEVDDVITGDIDIRDGSSQSQFRVDATQSPPLIDLFNNRVINFGIRSGESITYPDDPATETFVDFNSTSNSTAGTEQSYTFAAGGTGVYKVYSESDGAGGVQNLQFRALTQINLDSNDITDSGTDIWDASNQYIPQGRLENDAVTINANNGLTAGSVSLGGSVSIGISGALTLDNDLETVDGETIWDEANTYIPQTRLQNDSLTVSAGSGLITGGSVALGDSVTLDIGAGSFITVNSDDIAVNISDGLESDGSDNIRVSGSSIGGAFLSEGANPYEIEVDIGNGLTDDGSGNISVDESTAFSFTSEISFSSGLDVSGDISDGATVIWNSANQFIEQTALENDSITLNANNGLSAGSVSLGGSVAIGIDGNLTLDSSLEAPDGETIWDESNTYIPQGRLQNDSLTISAGDGLSSGGSVSLGSSVTLDIGAGSFITTNANDIAVNITNGLESDGADNIRVSASAIAGTFLSEGGSPHILEVNVGSGLTNDGSGNLAVDESVDFTFTSQIDFTNGLSVGSDIVDDTTTIWNSSGGYIEQAVLENDAITLNAGDGLKNGSTASLGGSFSLDIEPGDFAGSFLSDDGSDNLAVNIAAGLEGDGNGNIRVDEDADFTFTSALDFNAGLNVSADITDGSNVVWDSSAAEIPDSALGSISNSTLTNSSLSVTASSGLTGGGSISLGGSGSLSIGAGSFITVNADSIDVNIGEGLEGDGAGSIRVNEDKAFAFTSNIDFGSGITLTGGSITVPTGASIGDGTEIISDIGRSDISINDENGISQIAIKSSNSARPGPEIRARSGIPFTLRDQQGGFNAVTYSSSSNAGQGSLSVPGASLDIGGNNIILDNSGGIQLNADDTLLEFGANQDFGFLYESATDELVLKDGNGVELLRQAKSGVTRFIQGIDVGPISAPQDSFTQILNAPVTSALSAGSPVGYTFSLDNQSIISIEGESDGSGSIQNTSVSIGRALSVAGNLTIADSYTIDGKTGFLDFNNNVNLGNNGTGDVTIVTNAGTALTVKGGGDVEIGEGDLDMLSGRAIEWGDDQDFAQFYDSVNDELVIEDRVNDVELIRQPKQGPTQLIQGADVGTIESPDDSFTQLINTVVTSALPLGNSVGYSMAINNQTLMSITAESDGSGGIQNSIIEVGTDIASGNSTIWDDTNSYVPSDSLEFNTITVTSGSNLTGGGDVLLGGSTTISLGDPINLAQASIDTLSNNNNNFIGIDIGGTKVAEVDSSGNVDIEGELTEGAAL